MASPLTEPRRETSGIVRQRGGALRGLGEGQGIAVIKGWSQPPRIASANYNGPVLVMAVSAGHERIEEQVARELAEAGQ